MTRTRLQAGGFRKPAREEDDRDENPGRRAEKWRTARPVRGSRPAGPGNRAEKTRTTIVFLLFF